ncbi:MAG: hypothetical protein U1E56_01420 [Bauldia sp.]
MNKRFEDAVAEARQWPEADQDEAADLLMAIAARNAAPIDAKAHAAILEGVAQARRGEAASDEDIAAL